MSGSSIHLNESLYGLRQVDLNWFKEGKKLVLKKNQMVFLV